MTDGAHSLLVLGGSLSKNARPRVERFGSLVFAAATGNAPDQYPKETPFEDSIALVEGPELVAALVADAHFGAEASLQIATVFGELLVGSSAATTRAYGSDLMQRLARSVSDRMADGDRSASTLAAFVRVGSETLWMSYGDSYVLRVDRDAGRLEQLSTPNARYLGSSPTDATFADALEVGHIGLSRNELLLLATDGIEPDESGLEWNELPGFFEVDLLAAVTALVTRAADVEHGGGGDNLSIVAAGSAARR